MHMSEDKEVGSDVGRPKGKPDLETEVLDVLQGVPRYTGPNGRRNVERDLDIDDPLDRSTANVRSVLQKLASAALRRRDSETDTAIGLLFSQYEKDSKKPENCLWRHYSDIPEFVSSRDRRIDQPLEIPSSDSPIWDDLQEFVNRYIQFVDSDTALADFIKDTHKKDMNQKLIAGSLNLVNTVMKYQDSGHPLGALVFMDKSARNGGQMYRILWDEFSKTGAINSKYTRPNDRYINVGNDDPKSKLYSDATVSLLSAQYRKEDFGNRSLVVDEWMASGDSSGAAASILRYAAGVSFDRIEQFIDIPPWQHTLFAGVGDSDSDEDRQVLLLSINKLEPHQVEQLIRFKNSVDPDKFIETVDQIVTTKSEGNKEIKDILTLLSEGEDVNPTNFGSTLEKVMKYAGGLLAQPADRQNQTQVTTYRNFLIEFSRAYAALSRGEKVDTILEKAKQRTLQVAPRNNTP
jgi:hypothetical protein